MSFHSELPAPSSPRARSPLVDARAAFYAGHGWKGVHTGLEGSEPAYAERLLEAEYGHSTAALPPNTGRRPDETEAGADPGPAGSAAWLSRSDHLTATLRRACRLALPVAPEDLLAHRNAGIRGGAAVAEMWLGSVHHYGSRRAESALRELLTRSDLDGPSMALPLDLATASALRPLSAIETAEFAADRGSRAGRHAAWRHLHALPDGAALLPGPDSAADAYERLLLAPSYPPIASPAGEGAVVAQAMLLGDLDTPGQGVSGGLGVLVAGLGDRMAGLDGIASVITVVLAGRDALNDDARTMYERAPGHWIVRLPVDAAGLPDSSQMHLHRPALAWWAERLLGALPRRPQVVHVRHADDGSLALAEAAERLGSRVVFTAVPDPHRRVAGRLATPHTGPRPGELGQLRGDLHRIFVGDRLVERADTVIGVAGRCSADELVLHFPQLAEMNGGSGPAALVEGITPYLPGRDEERRGEDLVSGLFAGSDREDSLGPEDRNLPLFLCVGRMHADKQQDMLVRAWIASGLCTRSTLVLVGGSPAVENEYERDMRRRIRAALAGRPTAASRLAVLPALPNRAVRCLQHALVDPNHGVPVAWYVCPSAEEEFGLALLEAMEAGMPTAGPRQGGVFQYLHDGVGGVLLDTSSEEALSRGLLRMITLPAADRRRLAAVGRNVVTSRYSVAATADALIDAYGVRRRGRRSRAVPSGRDPVAS
ncbi:glycosyltransferase family 4 protein [Streptomyces sp. HB132]|uniref:glycosyltransferase family 4 protein n=1 Tax=Streptomyces sp. HB132 TaxID=767388 RepID=UPI0019607BF4|nr:glycosyltransferase family 4 protein [Streptomyces sp. HB132]MBM7439680.1 D-inositol-3-phosphate glycosyltransferase [Streptomyces sp. HB132]